MDSSADSVASVLIEEDAEQTEAAPPPAKKRVIELRSSFEVELRKAQHADALDELKAKKMRRDMETNVLREELSMRQAASKAMYDLQLKEIESRSKTLKIHTNFRYHCLRSAVEDKVEEGLIDEKALKDIMKEM